VLGVVSVSTQVLYFFLPIILFLVKDDKKKKGEKDEKEKPSK